MTLRIIKSPDQTEIGDVVFIRLKGAAAACIKIIKSIDGDMVQLADYPHGYQSNWYQNKVDFEIIQHKGV